MEMTALDALLPTTAMFVKAAARKSDPSAKSDPSDRGPDLRKYIILEHQGKEFAFIFPLAISHDRACPNAAGHLISAGSFSIIDGQVFLTGLGSETLRLKSRPQDAPLIQSLLSES
jgi:hypothetical protein